MCIYDKCGSVHVNADAKWPGASDSLELELCAMDVGTGNQIQFSGSMIKAFNHQAISQDP